MKLSLDLSLEACAGWAGGGGAPAVDLIPEATAPLSAVSATPVFALSSRSLTTGQTAKPWRVTNGTTSTEVLTLAEATAHGATKITHAYDSISATYIAFSSQIDFEANDSGGIRAKNTTGTAITLTIPTAARNAYNNSAGAYLHYVGKDLGSTTPGSPIPLILVSTNASATGVRHRLSITNATGGQFAGDGRRADADTALTQTMGWRHNGMEALGFNVDYANTTTQIIRYGDTATEKTDYFTGSVTAASNPLDAKVYVAPNATMEEAILWNAPLSSGDRAALRDSTVYHFPLTLNDGAASWWTNSTAKHPTLGLTAVGFTMGSGHCGIAEIEDATGRIIATKILGRHYTQDDHNSVAVTYTTEGNLVVVYTGHGNPIGGGSDATYRAYRSTTGRLADLSAPTTITTSHTKSNYGQLVEFAGKLIYFTNDDIDICWRVYYNSSAGDPTAWVEGQRVFKQGSAPGGGQNQVYALMRKVSETKLRFVCNAHPSNSTTPIKIIEADASGALNQGTGNLFGSASATPIDVSAMTTIYTPASKTRMLDMDETGTLLAIVDFSDATAGTHKVLIESGGSWTSKTVGASGAAFYAGSFYFHSMAFARESHSGIRAYRCRVDAGVYYLDRMDSADGGDNWTTTNLRSGATVMTRPFAPRNASGMPVLINEGTYTDFNTWRHRMVKP